MTFCGRCGTRLAPSDDAGHLGTAATQAAAPANPGGSPPAQPQQYPQQYPPQYAQQPPFGTSQPQWAAGPVTVPPRRRRGRTALILSVAAVLIVAALGVTGWQEHWPPSLFRSGPLPPLSWSAAQAPLPADAATGNAQNAQLDGVACAGAGSCVAVGSYEKTSGSGTRSVGLIETLAGGAWHPVAAPGLTAAQNGFVGLAGIACPAAGSCVSVGERSEGQNSASPVSEILSAGNWTIGSPALPADADSSKWANLNDISCVAPGTCVATGRYTDQNGNSEGFLDALSDGTWTATKAPLPADADQGKGTGNTLQTITFLSDVACTAAGACVATGQYVKSSGGTEGVIDTLSGGNWTAAKAPLPADAAASGQFAALWMITCQGTGSCLAGGHYTNKHGQPRYLIDSLSGGTWATMPDALPANAAADQQWSKLQATALDGLACRAAGSCVATASYVTSRGAVIAAVSTLSGGTWRTTGLPLPPAAAAAASQYAYPTLVACPEPDSCFTVGSYKAAGGIQQGLIETATGNTAAGNTAAGNTAAGNTAAGNTAAGNTATSNTATSNTAAGNTAASKQS